MSMRESVGSVLRWLRAWLSIERCLLIGAVVFSFLAWRDAAAARSDASDASDAASTAQQTIEETQSRVAAIADRLSVP